MNPILVVEVTSPSSEQYDRGDKLACYQLIPSVKAVCLVAPAEPRITLVERIDSAWRTTEFGAGQVLEVSAPLLRIAVDDLYRVLELVGCSIVRLTPLHTRATGAAFGARPATWGR